MRIALPERLWHIFDVGPPWRQLYAVLVVNEVDLRLSCWSYWWRNGRSLTQWARHRLWSSQSDNSGLGTNRLITMSSAHAAINTISLIPPSPPERFPSMGKVHPCASSISGSRQPSASTIFYCLLMANPNSSPPSIRSVNSARPSTRADTSFRSRYLR